MKNDIMTIRHSIFLLILFACSCIQHNTGNQALYEYDFQNPELSREVRINDLLQRLTLDEKISQLTNHSEAIDRLGIPEYDWWNECLHGVGRAGLATVFPQAIGLGATWNEDLFLRES